MGATLQHFLRRVLAWMYIGTCSAYCLCYISCSQSPKPKTYHLITLEPSAAGIYASTDLLQEKITGKASQHIPEGRLREWSHDLVTPHIIAFRVFQAELSYQENQGHEGWHLKT